MIKITILFTLALTLLLSARAEAQTRSLYYDYVGITPAVVATYTQTIKIDDVTVSGRPTCVESGVGTTCTIPIGILGSGNHKVDVIAESDGNTVITTKTGFNPANFPVPANQPRIVITITITTNP